MPYTQNQLAFTCNAFPCNPAPFLSELTELVLKGGPDVLKTDQAKMLLLTINMQAYGQLATIDLIDEFSRLFEISKSS